MKDNYKEERKNNSSGKKNYIVEGRKGENGEEMRRKIMKKRERDTNR